MEESDGRLGSVGSEPVLGGSAPRPVAVALLEATDRPASHPRPDLSKPAAGGREDGRPLAYERRWRPLAPLRRSRRARARVTPLGSWESAVRMAMGERRGSMHRPPASVESARPAGFGREQRRTLERVIALWREGGIEVVPVTLALLHLLTSVQPKGNEWRSELYDAWTPLHKPALRYHPRTISTRPSSLQ